MNENQCLAATQLDNLNVLSNVIALVSAIVVDLTGDGALASTVNGERVSTACDSMVSARIRANFATYLD